MKRTDSFRRVSLQRMGTLFQGHATGRLVGVVIDALSGKLCTIRVGTQASSQDLLPPGAVLQDYSPHEQHYGGLLAYPILRGTPIWIALDPDAIGLRSAYALVED